MNPFKGLPADKTVRIVDHLGRLICETTAEIAAEDWEAAQIFQSFISGRLAEEIERIEKRPAPTAKVETR